MMSRVGVLGGMFDPVHLGHINAACYVCESLKLDCIKLVPCNQPNHRGAAYESTAHRVKMLELSIATHPKLEIDECEIRRGGVSYAVETIEQLKQGNNTDQFVFILGIDSFNTLPRWHKWNAMLDLCHLFVLPRNGMDVCSEVANALKLNERIVQNPEDLFQKGYGNIFLDGNFSFDSSSTSVRQKLESQNELDSFLNKEVIEYIYRHGLYGSSANRVQNATI